MLKYYVEFECSGQNEYILQSKWFNKPESAIHWYKKSFDYVADDKIRAYLMQATFIDKETYTNIKTLGDITMKYFLK